MMVWLLFIIDLMGLFFYNKIGSIISIGDLPTTNIIEPVFLNKLFEIISYISEVKPQLEISRLNLVYRYRTVF